MRALPLFILSAVACAAEPQSATNECLRAAYDPVARTFTVTDVRAGRTWTTLAGAELSDNALRWYLDGTELVVEINLPPETPQPRPLAFPGPFRAEKGDRFILPHGCGFSLPADFPDFRPHELDRLQVYSRDMKMGCWAQYAESVASDGSLRQGAGMLAILETPADAWVSFAFRAGGLRAAGPEWSPEKGRFGYARRIRYAFFDAATPGRLAARYRTEMDRRGYRVTFAEKARRNPRLAAGLNLLKGAPDIWYWTTRTNKAEVARELRRIGFGNFLFCSITRRDLGVWVTPEEVRAVAEIPDVLQAEYDIYTDTMEPAMLDKIDAVRPHWPLEVWERGDYVADANGVPRRGWKVALKSDPAKPVIGCLRLCERQAPSYLRARVARRLVEAPYGARFFDVTGTSVGTCDNPRHPLTRRQSVEARRALLAIAGNEFGLVTGSEDGLECYVPECDWFEGNFSAARWRVDGGRYMWRIYDETPPVMERAIDPATRCPFWEMVFHDCVSSTWYWTDYNNKFPHDWWKRDLLNVVSGTPPMYLFTPEVFEEQKDRLAASVRVATPVARATADAVLEEFAWLTADRLVQQARFSNGVVATVNFGDRPFTLADGTVLAPRGGVSSFPALRSAVRCVGLYSPMRVGWRVRRATRGSCASCAATTSAPMRTR